MCSQTSKLWTRQCQHACKCGYDKESFAKGGVRREPERSATGQPGGFASAIRQPCNRVPRQSIHRQRLPRRSVGSYPSILRYSTDKYSQARVAGRQKAHPCRLHPTRQVVTKDTGVSVTLCRRLVTGLCWWTQ